jgi:hypothetical protein
MACSGGLRQTFYATTAQNPVTKVVLGKAPKPVYNLASEKSKIRMKRREVPALFSLKNEGLRKSLDE